MITPPLPPHPLVKYWQDRHPYPVNFIIHMIGIPPTILGALLIPVYLGLQSWKIFAIALAAFVGGYLIQFAGHVWDRTTPGEIIYFKRKRGWNYVEFPAPRKGSDEFAREVRG